MAFQDIADVPKPVVMNGSSNKSSLLEIHAEIPKDNGDKEQSKEIPAAIGIVKTEGLEKLEAKLVNSEVEYIESEELKDVEDVDSCMKTLVAELCSKDWVALCRALNNVRRLSLFHKEALVSALNDIISLVVKSVKNPRSAVCKTAIMTSVDIFRTYKDGIVDSLDPLLVQLLLKSSQDKKFVCEAAESALITLTSSVSPLLLLPKLQPYIKDRNPRIRAKASMCISRSVPRLGIDGIEAFGIEKLIQVGASQLSDQLPESRDAARSLLLELQSAYERSHIGKPNSLSEVDATTPSWECFCESKLSPLNAQAVLRVTNFSREGLAQGGS
ncbi:hypothetical protein M569_01470 [Genlisea aurea]|uniref:TOG domain-containing protein n=1 Tax=Genlisea aurea TaxID=192259 RepID=S8EBG1_9LAMI|nr:hypothetical protein M569_01470 [Genlisea aurea]